MRKSQITVYLDSSTLEVLNAYSARQNKPKSLVAEAAIASFLSPDAGERQEAAMAKRLDRIGRVLDRLVRNDEIALETLALFIRFWLTATPSLPEQSTPAARAKGGERYGRFVQALGRRLASGASLTREITTDANEALSTSDR